MSLGEWKDVFELASYIVIVLGLPAALYQYRRSVLKEQQDREYGTYNALDEKYLEFQRMCFEHPRLDIFDIPDGATTALSPVEQKQELVAFTMLFSIFERAFLMYADQSSTIKRRQWSGWHEYLTDFCSRENFRRAWRISGNTFDTTFQDFVERTMRQVQGEHSSMVTLRELHADNSDELAVLAELLANARIAGCRLSSNELAHLATGGPTIDVPSFGLIATTDDSVGALLTTTREQGQLLIVAGIGTRGPRADAIIHAFLRELASRNEFIAARVLVMETPLEVPASLQRGVPGMACFRQIDVRYEYPDRTPGRLWIWTTVAELSRDEVRHVLQETVDLYRTLRPGVVADIDRILRDAPDMIPTLDITTPVAPAESHWTQKRA